MEKGCREIDACYFDGSLCGRYGKCQDDGSSCLCDDGYISNVGGTKKLYTNVEKDACVPSAKAEDVQKVGPESFVFNIDLAGGHNAYRVNMKKFDALAPDLAPVSVFGHDDKTIQVPSNYQNRTKFEYAFANLIPGVEYEVQLTPWNTSTEMEVSGTKQKTTAITYCCCNCNASIKDDTSGRPVDLNVSQELGKVMFKFVDNSRCSEAFAFSRSEVGAEFMDNDDETLKQAFTPNYNYVARKRCGMAPIDPGTDAADHLWQSKLEVNKLYRYCVRGVAQLYSADSLHSSDGKPPLEVQQICNACRFHFL